MVIGIFGESCVGKTTLAEKVSEAMNARIYAGKDYLRLAKNENIAKKMFETLLQEAVVGDSIIYVISEKEHLKLLPEGAIRILVTADLELIKDRFAARIHGKLPAPIEKMLEKKHGCFDKENYDLHISSLENDNSDIVNQIMALIHK